MSATSSEAIRAKVMVRAKGINNWPTIPPTKASGMKMTMVARVAEVMGVATSLTPLRAASLKCSPCCIRRYITSITTMLLSITRPTTMAIALRVSRLMVIPHNRMARKPMMILKGIETAVTREARKAIRKRKTTMMARTPPIMVLRIRSLMLPSINSDWSSIVKSSTLSPRVALIFSTSSTTALATETVLASASFTTVMLTLGLPLVRLIAVPGGGPRLTPAISLSSRASVPIAVFSIWFRELYS
ncbi:hypothetical protein ES703_66925 [subsurface metagenome]